MLFAEMLQESLRQLLRHPFFAAGVALLLALGIGVNAVMFGIVDRTLLSLPLHVSDPETVKILYRHQVDQGKTSAGGELTYGNYLAQQDHSGFERVAIQVARQPLSGHGDSARRLEVRLVSASFFPTLGVKPERGRFFTPQEDQRDADPVVVISHSLWINQFAGNPAVLRRKLEVGSLEYDIIGVTPRGFTGFELTPVDVWMPFRRAMQGLDLERWLDSEAPWSWAQTVVRLKPGVSIEAAEAESTAILKRVDQQLARPPQSQQRRISLQPLTPALRADAGAETKVAFWLAAVSLLVLLIACANVANLFLVRGLRRRREIALRLTLGLGRLRLLAQLVSESMLLAVLGCAAALGLAYWAGRFARSFLFPQVDWSSGLLSPRLTVYSLGLALLAAMLASLPAALQARRPDLLEPLKSSGGTASPARSPARSLLLVAQTALSVLLLVGAGLFLHSLNRVESLDLGYRTENIVLLTPELETGLDRMQNIPLFKQALDHLSQQPGVQSAAAAWTVPFVGGISYEITYPDGRALPRLPTGGPWSVAVMGDYFRTMDIDLVRGRAFNRNEERTDVPPSLIVGQTMADLLWPQQDPLGQCLVFKGTDFCCPVVGVAEDVTRREFGEGATMLFYMSLSQVAQGYPPRHFYLRTLEPPAAPGPQDLRRLLLQMDSRFRYVEARTFQHLTAGQKRAWTLGATLFTLFGLLALAVAAVGLYSVLTFEAARRRREMSIRSALGATLRQLAWLVLSRSLRLSLAGIALGLALAALLAPNLTHLLFETSPHQPLIYAATAAVILFISLLASALPAYGNFQTDPAATLKAE